MQNRGFASQDGGQAPLPMRHKTTVLREANFVCVKLRRGHGSLSFGEFCVALIEFGRSLEAQLTAPDLYTWLFMALTFHFLL